MGLLLPFLGFVISAFLPENKEKLISIIAFSTVFIQFLGDFEYPGDCAGVYLLQRTWKIAFQLAYA